MATTNERKPVEERNDYRAHMKFNHNQYIKSMERMEKKSSDWLFHDPAEFDLDFDDYCAIATIFDLGYDRIYIRRNDIKPIIKDPLESYRIKTIWIDHMIKMVATRMGGEDYGIFKFLYDSFEKQHWGGNEVWRTLALGTNHGTSSMSAMKNLCWYKHLEGKMINFETLKIAQLILMHGMYWNFDPRIRVIYDDSASEADVYEWVSSDAAIAHSFMGHVLNHEWEDAYLLIKRETED